MNGVTTNSGEHQERDIPAMTVKSVHDVLSLFAHDTDTLQRTAESMHDADADALALYYQALTDADAHEFDTLREAISIGTRGSVALRADALMRAGIPKRYIHGLVITAESMHPHGDEHDALHDALLALAERAERGTHKLSRGYARGTRAHTNDAYDALISALYDVREAHTLGDALANAERADYRASKFWEALTAERSEQDAELKHAEQRIIEHEQGTA